MYFPAPLVIFTPYLNEAWKRAQIDYLSIYHFNRSTRNTLILLIIRID